jgi:hypothetical protein
VFLRSEAASLPAALAGIAHELTVHYPWGSLLRAVLDADPVTLARILGLGRPGAALRIRINESALAAAGIREASLDSLISGLGQAFGEAGVTVVLCGCVPAEADTSWGARVRGGAPSRVLAIDGTLAERKGIPGGGRSVSAAAYPARA